MDKATGQSALSSSARDESEEEESDDEDAGSAAVEALVEALEVSRGEVGFRLSEGDARVLRGLIFLTS